MNMGYLDKNASHAQKDTDNFDNNTSHNHNERGLP